MEPLVSILIPAYNAEQTIGGTLESATSQTWKRKEVIVVNDGSRDRTASIAKTYASHGVKVVNRENQGAAAARNHALSLCQGDYIQWLDADDLLSPDKVERQIRLLQNSLGVRTLLSCEWGYFIYRPSRALFSPSPLWADLAPLEWLVRKWENNAHMQTATWLVSRELTQAAGPWNTHLLGDDDGEYFFRVILQSDGTRFCPEAKVFYRRSGSARLSHIGRSKAKQDAQFLSMRMQIQKLLALQDTQRLRAACLTYLQNWLVHFYPERPDIVEQAQRLAEELGGKLEMPPLRWKYAWLKPIFGYGFAKYAQTVLPELRWSATRAWDRAMYALSAKQN